jgi:hypothetical protein
MRPASQVSSCPTFPVMNLMNLMKAPCTCARGVAHAACIVILACVGTASCTSTVEGDGPAGGRAEASFSLAPQRPVGPLQLSDSRGRARDGPATPRMSASGVAPGAVPLSSPGAAQMGGGKAVADGGAGKVAGTPAPAAAQPQQQPASPLAVTLPRPPPPAAAVGGAERVWPSPQVR